MLCIVAIMTCFISCSKDKNDNDSTSAEENMLIGTWRLWDDYFAHYSTGWCDKMVLKKDHTYVYDWWGDAWGNNIQTSTGSWSYDASERKFYKGSNYQYLITLSNTELVLMDNDGDEYHWKKQ